MAAQPFAKLTAIVPALVLFSCAPKAVVVEQPPAVVKKEEKPVEPTVPVPAVPGEPDDGLRLPEMLSMPSDHDFQATVPVAPAGVTGAAGAVTARPPTDPPPRPKPKEENAAPNP